MSNETDAPAVAVEAEAPASDGILAVRRGPGANCSSIGSAVEMLFLSATVGAAVLAAVVAALPPAKREAPPAPPPAPPASPERA